MKHSLTAAMITRNESDRYLDEILTDLTEYCTEIVILDDSSDDETKEVITSYDNTHLYTTGKPMFRESEARIKDILWRQILPKHKPEYVLTIDADEKLDPRFKDKVQDFLDIPGFNRIGFTILECWGDKDMIRVDKGWNPAGKITPLINRWLPQVNYCFPPLKLHTGRAPLNQPHPMLFSGYFMIHYGYADPEDIKRKREWYMTEDTNPAPEMAAHYHSMFDEKPVLVPLKLFIGDD
jgi:glycosyltransferase involved in cell wall biosynthesis